MLNGITGTTGDVGSDILAGVTCVFSFGTVCPDASDSSSAAASGAAANAGTNAAAASGTTTTAAALPEIATAEAITAANAAAIPSKPFSGSVCYTSGWC